MMATKRLAVVMGATRGQGSSVVNALLHTNQYTVRGVTTASLDTPEADNLRNRGVELLGVNLDDSSTLSAAFSSAQVVFAVTTMYDGDMKREIVQGRNIADAVALIPTVEHFIWSTMPSASDMSNGTMLVPHMDGKAQVDSYIIETHLQLARKTTFYWGGFYAENVTYPPFKSYSLGEIGKRVWIQAVGEDTLVPMVGDHTINTGLIAQRILEMPHLSLPMRYVLGVVDWMRHGDLLRAWSDILSEKQGDRMDPVYVCGDIKTVAQLWPDSAEEFGQMLKYSEAYGMEAWTKKGVQALTIHELGLRPGNTGHDLVSTVDALRKLAAKSS